MGKVSVEKRVVTVIEKGSLVHDEGTIEDHEQLKSYTTNYYKNLFGG
jgi:hypothetical protein